MSASPRPIARTLVPISDPSQVDVYAKAVWSVRSMVMSSRTGQCVATPFAEPPKTAKLRVF